MNCKESSDTSYTRRKSNRIKVDDEKKNRKDSIKKVSLILKKCESLRSAEENKLLDHFSDVTKQIKKRKERIQIYKERVIEKEDSPDVIYNKAEKLADIISKAKHLVCYTGAGISTSAHIPDYRGSNGIWTLLQQGKEIEKYDLSLANPTYTHMALYELHKRNILRYVISQNCDGLHLRAGLPRKSISELHGNMYIEVCKYCRPNVEYWRLFDTTEGTGRFNHKTNRRCRYCQKPLIDSIVHFGERGSLKWPLNWAGACKQSENADVILCLGSSLKVLKKYTWLWQMDRPKNKRAKICIVNLQWTSKDNAAILKINGKCDEIMKIIMKNLNIKTAKYSRGMDPIFAHASLLSPEELHTVSQPMLKAENNLLLSDTNPLKNNSIDCNSLFEKETTPATQKNTSNFKADLNIYNRLLPTHSDSCTITSDFDSESFSSDEINFNIKENKNVKLFNSKTADEINNFKTTGKVNDFNTVGFLGINKSSNTENNLKYLNGNSLNDLILKGIIIKTEPKHDNNNHNSNIDINFLNNETRSLNILDHNLDTKSFPCDIYLGYMHANKSNNIINKSSLLIDIQPISQLNENTTEIKMNKIIHSTNQQTENTPKCVIKMCDIYQKFDQLPNWYEVRYAYSGLHSIIKPPPKEINLWNSNIVPVFKMNREEAECLFCFEIYAEFTCQFYRKISTEFITNKFRKGKAIVCECCDNSDFDDIKIESNEGCINKKYSEKRPRLELKFLNEPMKQIQAGWFGKGYRKSHKKRKK